MAADGCKSTAEARRFNFEMARFFQVCANVHVCGGAAGRTWNSEQCPAVRAPNPLSQCRSLGRIREPTRDQALPALAMRQCAALADSPNQTSFSFQGFVSVY